MSATVEAENERATQWICETEPVCQSLPSPDDGGECTCQRVDGTDHCDACLAPMIEIDFETGERVPAMGASA